MFFTKCDQLLWKKESKKQGGRLSGCFIKTICNWKARRVWWYFWVRRWLAKSTGCIGEPEPKPLFTYNSRLYIFHFTSEERLKSQRNADGHLFVSTLHFWFPVCWIPDVCQECYLSITLKVDDLSFYHQSFIFPAGFEGWRPFPPSAQHALESQIVFCLLCFLVCFHYNSKSPNPDIFKLWRNIL